MPHPRKKKPGRAATLADVGRAAGVSAMAASVVLNGARSSSRIAPETRARILAAAARLRYRPNAAARALAERRMHTIGVATVVDVGGALNHYFLEVFNGILEAATRHRQNTAVFTLSDWERDASRLPGLCDGRIDGLILIAPVLSPEAIRALPDHTPFVALHSNIPIPGSVNLESDEATGAYEMVRHLISRGHRRILHITGKRGLLGAERRILGYKRALASARIPFEASLLVDAGFTGDEGRQALHALAGAVGRPAAAAGDLLCQRRQRHRLPRSPGGGGAPRARGYFPGRIRRYAGGPHDRAPADHRAAAAARDGQPGGGGAAGAGPSPARPVRAGGAGNHRVPHRTGVARLRQHARRCARGRCRLPNRTTR